MKEPQQDQERPPEQPPEGQEESLRRGVELETGELLPRWITVTLWAVFLPFCVFAAFWIGRSIIVQQRIQDYLQVLSGPWEGKPPPMESDVVENGLQLFEEEARPSLLLILQRLIREEIDDPRMARAIALRKATEWGLESRRRQLFEEILQHMSTDGDMPPDYELPPEHRKTLTVLLEERQQRKTVSYEQQKITEVLTWLAQGRPTPPKGPEHRRVRSLQNKYEKRLFVGEEREVLEELAESWPKKDAPVKQSAGTKFALMLEEKPTELTPQETMVCEEVAQGWEDRYMLGEERLTHVARRLVKYIEANNVFIDHPEVWEVIRLTQHRHPPARDNMKDAVFALRNRKYCHIFLSNFLLKTAINPVMAVETVRLTKDEHEQQLRAENHRRRMACLEVARDIAKTYCTKPFPIDEVPKQEEPEFFRNHIIEPMETLLEDDDVGAKARQMLDSIDEDCADFLQ